MHTHLILGSGGFLGRHLARELAGRGERVVEASRASARPFHMENADWDQLIDGSDVIHHLAWSRSLPTPDADSLSFLDRDIRPTVALLEALRRRPEKRLVFASSAGAVYGVPQATPIQEDHPRNPTSPYGLSKLVAETYLDSYRTTFGLDIRVARIANVYGAGQKPNVGAASTFLHKALANEKVTLWGDGEAVRDYLYVQDAIGGWIAIAAADRASLPADATFNLSSGKGLSLNQVIRAIESVLGRSVAVEYREGRSFDVPVSVVDPSRAKAILGWAASIPFEEGIVIAAADLGRRAA